VAVGCASTSHPLAVPLEREVAYALTRDVEGLEAVDRCRAVEAEASGLELQGGYDPESVKSTRERTSGTREQWSVVSLAWTA
jgi:hypothetical protein